MIKQIVFVVLLALVAVNTGLEDKPGYCTVGDVYIKEGETAGGPIGECMRVTCGKGAPGPQSVSGVGCGTFGPRPGCTLSDYDNTKRYPDCCAREICPTEVNDNKLD